MNEQFFSATLRQLRPKQWAKQIFVLAPVPYVVGQQEWVKIGTLCLLFVAFCAAASSVYVVNDLMDREKDRLHPQKCKRPIASGLISVPLAIYIACGLTGTALGMSGMIGWKAIIYLGTYLTISHVYTFKAKHVAYIDVSVVGSLYGIRVLAGFSAVAMQPAGWLIWAFLAFFLATFIELGKRYAELRTIGDGAKTRKVLESYSDKGINRYFVIVSIAIVGLYPFAAWRVEPWFATSLMLVGPALYLFHTAIKNLTADTHPMEVIIGSRVLVGIVVAFSMTFLAACVL